MKLSQLRVFLPLHWHSLGPGISRLVGALVVAVSRRLRVSQKPESIVISREKTALSEAERGRRSEAHDLRFYLEFSILVLG